eukprot:3136455-Pleurochrysis_carterae.AAC.1
MATGFNAITFAPLFSPHARTVLMSNALATPYTLAKESAQRRSATRTALPSSRPRLRAHVASFAEVAHVS